MFTFDESELLLETLYVGRMSTSPLISVNKNSLVGNAAFKRTYFPDVEKVYIQLIKKPDHYHLLITESNLQKYYAFKTFNCSGTPTMQAGNRSIINFLGKSGTTRRYEILEVEDTIWEGVRSFKLNLFREDKATSKKV